VETTLIGGTHGTFQIDANELAVGDVYKFEGGGTINIGTPTDLTIALKANAVVLDTTAAISEPNLNDRDWYLQIILTVRSIGATGEITMNGFFKHHTNSLGAVESFPMRANITPFDTTINQLFDLTALWTAADPSNVIQTENFVLSKIK